MHYYGTYSMARCAGLQEPVAHAIATAAEYVDDSDFLVKQLADGKVLISEPTAHHPKNAKNLERIDQERTWVPFHFFPGGEGEDAQRLVCTMDSAYARQMVSRNLTLARERYGLPLIGITAHVYADTFAHYGFAGVSSPINSVKWGSIEFDQLGSEEERLRKEQESFKERFIEGPIADILSRLGHAGGATFPDQPYLTWRFTYASEDEPTPWRRNQETFLVACEKMHAMFLELNRITEGDYADDRTRVSFASIKGVVQTILATRLPWQDRAIAWSDAVAAGRLFPNPTHSPIPAYDPRKYLDDLAQLDKLTAEDARKTQVFQFLEAANNHREYVLNTMLKENGIAFETTFADWVRDKIATACQWAAGKEQVTA